MVSRLVSDVRFKATTNNTMKSESPASRAIMKGFGEPSTTMPASRPNTIPAATSREAIRPIRTEDCCRAQKAKKRPMPNAIPP